MHTPAYLHTFIGCNKTPVFTQALKIQKLNERNDVQFCVPLLVVTLRTWITHGRHCHHPNTFIVGHDTYSKQCLRTTRVLENVSWPQKGIFWLHFPEVYPPGGSAPYCGPYSLMLAQRNITASWGQRLSGCLQSQVKQQLSVSSCWQNNSSNKKSLLDNDFESLRHSGLYAQNDMAILRHL